ncbi:MAG: universal stress protein [Pseudomonadota bacterium]
MDYKSIAVCVDNSNGSPRQLKFALALAARHNAHLTGLHLTYGPLVPYDPYGQAAAIMMEWEETIMEKQARAEKSFRAAAQDAGINFDWLAFRSSERDEVLARARATDLVIVGQRDPADLQTDVGHAFHESFVLKLGRPVLFLPYTGELPGAFDNIIIAWDGGREAARAMADALPFLKKARQVKVLTVAEKEDRETDLPDVDIAAYLARHGVRIEIEKNEGVDMDPAEWLLSRAADLGADLLVMGAYGHSRMSELVLGGVTRSMLREMTVPVLMSH